MGCNTSQELRTLNGEGAATAAEHQQKVDECKMAAAAAFASGLHVPGSAGGGSAGDGVGDITTAMPPDGFNNNLIYAELDEGMLLLGDEQQQTPANHLQQQQQQYLLQQQQLQLYHQQQLQQQLQQQQHLQQQQLQQQQQISFCPTPASTPPLLPPPGHQGAPKLPPLRPVQSAHPKGPAQPPTASKPAEILVLDGGGAGGDGGAGNMELLDMEMGEDEEKAATKIQAVFRGHQVRATMSGKPEISSNNANAAAAAIAAEADPTKEELEAEFDPNDKELCDAASKIQAAFRGHMNRKVVNKEDLDIQEITKKVAEELDIDLSDPELNKAATKIQASFRGHKTRKDQGTD